MKSIHFFIINILLCFQSLAQEANYYFINENHIRLLKSGSLLVRLESKENKLSYMTKALLQDNCSPKCKEKISKQIQAIISERDLYNLEFIKSFKSKFKFCPVYFYFDKDQKVLIESNLNKKYFLDSITTGFSSRNLTMDSLIILGKDVTPESSNEGWMFQSTKGIVLKNGFPYITENNLTTLWNRLSSSDHLQKNCNYMVRKLNKNLFRYYQDAEFRRMEGENSIME